MTFIVVKHLRLNKHTVPSAAITLLRNRHNNDRVRRNGRRCAFGYSSPSSLQPQTLPPAHWRSFGYRVTVHRALTRNSTGIQY